MKRLLILLCCMTLVACSNNEGGAGSDANGTIENEVVIESKPLLEDDEKIESFLRSLEGFDYSEDVIQTPINMDSDDTLELVFETASGQLIILDADEEDYIPYFVNTTLDEHSTYKIEGAFLIIETNYDKEKSLEIHFIKTDGIVRVTEFPISLDTYKVIDPYTGTFEVKTSSIENIDTWVNFKLHTTSIYTDEYGQTHPIKDVTYTYQLDKINNTYNFDKDDQSLYESGADYEKTVERYGEDESLMTFERVYADTDLAGAIDYYETHRNDFVKDAKENFANAIMDEIRDIVLMFTKSDDDFFEFVEVSDEGIFFVRNDAQMIPKLQSLLAYYETRSIKDGQIGDVFYKVGFRPDLSKGIYSALCDSNVMVDKSSIKTWLVMVHGLEEFQASSIPMPNVVIGENESLADFEGMRKADLIKRLTLLNDPIELTNLKSLKTGQKFGGLKISYLEKEKTAFNINMRGDESFEGILWYDAFKDEYYVGINQEPLKYFYYEFPEATVYFNLMSGTHQIMTYKETPEEIFPEALLTKIQAGEKVPVQGAVKFWFFNTQEEWLTSASDNPNVEILEIWEKE